MKFLFFLFLLIFSSSFIIQSSNNTLDWIDQFKIEKNEIIDLNKNSLFNYLKFQNSFYHLKEFSLQNENDLILYLDHKNNIISLSFTSKLGTKSLKVSFKKPNIIHFKELKLKKEEVQEKKEEERGFFAKYWYYIIPILLMLLFTPPPPPEENQ